MNWPYGQREQGSGNHPTYLISFISCLYIASPTRGRISGRLDFFSFPQEKWAKRESEEEQKGKIRKKGEIRSFSDSLPPFFLDIR